jgi:hypothetical protein
MRTNHSILTAIAASTTFAAAAPTHNEELYKHVIAISVDGLHSSDIGKYVAARPKSTIGKLLQTGYEYTDAYTSAPSDSFPGTLAQYCGAGPATTGVWYDDTWDRSIWAPGSNCEGPPGAEGMRPRSQNHLICTDLIVALFDETIEYNSTLVFSGGIDPSNLPLQKHASGCVPIYPHNRLRVNTIFEVAVAHGLQTAYTDKHQAYDLVSGPSGKGLSVRYFPEQTGYGGTVNDTISYDTLHVNAWLDWIDGISPVNSSGSITSFPALMGGNFQSVSVAEKTVEYNNDSSLSTGLLQAIDFVDTSLGKIVAKLESKNLYNDTLIIIASKHGQAPIDPILWNEVDPAALANNTGVPTAWITTDDIALIFLNSSSDTPTAVANLMAKQSELKINSTYSGQTLIDMGFGNPLTDPAVPDIIVRPQLGTCYTTSKSKTAEHGGLSDDDRKVACILSSPRLEGKKFNRKASTKQVGPTVLRALGLPMEELQGATKEKVDPLEGFCDW